MSRDVIESRCGLRCSECNPKENWGVECPGCINMENPFWGVCDVKNCCEAKGFDNCGRCEDLPCEDLVAMTADPEHGCGGARIENCKTWCSITKGSQEVDCGGNH